MPGKTATHLIIVDVGNSRMKIGRVARGLDNPSTLSINDLPVPDAAIDLAIDHATGGFDESRLAAWCDEYLARRCRVGDGERASRCGRSSCGRGYGVGEAGRRCIARSGGSRTATCPCRLASISRSEWVSIDCWPLSPPTEFANVIGRRSLLTWGRRSRSTCWMRTALSAAARYFPALPCRPERSRSIPMRCREWRWTTWNIRLRRSANPRCRRLKRVCIGRRRRGSRTRCTDVQDFVFSAGGLSHRRRVLPCRDFARSKLAVHRSPSAVSGAVGNRLGETMTAHHAPTVVAELTPQGRAAVAVVGVAGPRTLALVQRFFSPVTPWPDNGPPIGRIMLGRWGGDARRGAGRLPS